MRDLKCERAEGERLRRGEDLINGEGGNGEREAGRLRPFFEDEIG